MGSDMYYIKERVSGLYVEAVAKEVYSLGNIKWEVNYTDEIEEATLFGYGTDAVELLGMKEISTGIFEVMCKDKCTVLFTLYNED